MKYAQTSLFGNGAEKMTKMQRLHGVGQSGKTCKHLIAYRPSNRTYYKCELFSVSSSAATDIRVRDAACGMYEEESDA